MPNNHKLCPKCNGIMHRQSKQCRKCYIEEKLKPENYINKKCPVCGKEFSVHISHIKREQGKYCSISCARRGSPTKKRTKVEVVCYSCGKSFTKHKSEIRKNVSGKHFCSSQCWYSYNQLENHYGWSGGQHERMNPEYRVWRKAVIERDKGVCRRCHATSNLHVHHIYRFNDKPHLRWDVGNGITLCKDCHKMVTGNELYWEDNFFDMISLCL